MNFEDSYLQARTRRHFFRDCGIGVGKMALASMLARDGFAAGVNSMKALHHPAKIDHVIYLFQCGGPSQLELFDYKPELTKFHQKPVPESLMKGKRFALHGHVFEGAARFWARRASSSSTENPASI
jgi:hypothetical protein